MRGAVPASSAGSAWSSAISAATVTLAKTSRRRVIGKDRDRGLRDDVAGIRLVRHVVKRRAGFAFAVQDRPVHRYASAVFGQQRSMHVERAARRDGEQRRLQHLPKVEAEDEVGRKIANPRDGLACVDVGRHDRGDAVVAGNVGHALEPDRFVRIVVVRDHQRDANAVRQQDAQAAGADVVIGEDDGGRHGDVDFTTRRRDAEESITRS